MTNCIFFPFSHIDSCQRRTLQHFVPQCSYLSLDIPETFLSEYDTDALDPVYFSPNDIQEVKTQAAAFQHWAFVHQGNQKNLKSFFHQNPWLSDPDNTAGIISQIRTANPDHLSGKDSAQDSWKESLLLLELFRMVDQENQSIHSGLQQVDQKQKAIFARLQGNISKGSDPENQEDRETFHGREPGSWMTEKRVFSWWDAAMHKGLLTGTTPLILITTSPDVYALCCQGEQESTNALDIDPIKVHEDTCSHHQPWQRDFLQCLQDILIGKDIDRKKLPESCTSCSRTGYIRFQILSENQKTFLAQGNSAGQDRPIGLCLMGLYG